MKHIFKRREFLKKSIVVCGSGIALPVHRSLLSNSRFSADKYFHEAKYYDKLPNRKIKCLLCPRECVIDDLETGYCGVRENYGGIYYTLVYGKPCTAHVDPIEKKPLFHFLPGSLAFSLATVGCNVLCKFCQNWEISQARPDQVESFELPPLKLADYASSNKCDSIAYTYTEPVVFTEYMYDCAKAGKEAGIKSVMISNGYIQEKPMNDLCDVLDAVKIDLKAFTDEFYINYVAGRLQPVLETLKLLAKRNVWTEIVYLVIPTLNDNTKDLEKMCHWIVNELGADTPIHFSRFYPQYRLKNLPPTPVATLEKARNIALEAGINYAYIGNIPGHEGENTFCPKCKNAVIRRLGYQILEFKISKSGQCDSCGYKIAGIWN